MNKLKKFIHAVNILFNRELRGGCWEDWPTGILLWNPLLESLFGIHGIQPTLPRLKDILEYLAEGRLERI